LIEEATMTHAHVIEASRGDTFDLGIIKLRLLVGADQTQGTFALGEFSGAELGPWTVPHIHEKTEESFYVLDGDFTFTLDKEDVEAGPGSFILVPRGTVHVMRAAAGGGRFLTLWTPGGAEEMFKELSRMPADSLRNPMSEGRYPPAMTHSRCSGR
jgi:quercetin dioxygenase-like cupin family protein